jgi:CRISPR-associated protein Csx10
MNALTFRIHAIQPLLITQLSAGEENSSIAFSFIPGSVLRGAIINHYLRKHHIKDVAQDPICRHLFFNGAVNYLNAYPLNPLGQRTLPKPLSWRIRKDDLQNFKATIYDFAIEFRDDVDNPLMPLGDFCCIDENFVGIYGPTHSISVHNSSEDRNAKREDDSTVYRYDAIAAGETFAGVIVAEDLGDLQTLISLLEGSEFSLGGSRSAGFGRVRFEDFHFIKDWQEYTKHDGDASELIILTLLSDAIIRDGNGQITTDLGSVLGWDPLRYYQKIRIVGGFNRKWGLPLVQSFAIQAGSVFVYRASYVDREVLQQLEQDGVGERRTEGFGRIAINWHTQAELQRRTSSKDFILPLPSLSEQSQQLAQCMAERRLRNILDRKLIDAISHLRIDSAPKNAQLSRLRLIVRSAWRQNNPRLVVDHLKSLKGAKSQFERAHIDNNQLLSWLIDGIEQHKLWETHLKPAEFPTMAGITSKATDKIEVEYTMRLLDALLQRTTRDERPLGGD